MSDIDEECTGEGKCHGCMKWCHECGDVAHVCDARLRDERCAEHPVPHDDVVLRSARCAAEKMIEYGRRMAAEGRRALEDVVDGENARRIYNQQREKFESDVMNGE